MIRAKDIRSIEELIDKDGCVLIKIVTVINRVAYTRGPGTDLQEVWLTDVTAG